MAEHKARAVGAIIVFMVLSTQTVDAKSLSLMKRAAFYIANGTGSGWTSVCNVDGVVYQNNEKIPTDNPCESCYCRPPGFACVLKDCELKPHCKAVRREGQCCPDYHCDGCEHDGQFYSDGQVIPNTGSPCYTCYCQGASITCSLVSCTFRNDCTARYNPGECCPRYDHCSPKNANTKETLQPATLPTTLFQSRLTRFKTFEFPPEFPARALGQGDVFPRGEDSRFSLTIPPPVRPNYYFTGNPPAAPDRENEISDSQRQREVRGPESSTTPPTTTSPIESSARTSEGKTAIFIDEDQNSDRKITDATSPQSTVRETTTTPGTTPSIELTTADTRITFTSTTPASTTTTTVRTTTSTTTPRTTEASSPPTTTTTTTTTTTPPPKPTAIIAQATESSPLPPTTSALTALPEKDMRHISEDDVTRIDDVTQKLTAVTKSIFRKASSSASPQIADWELDEFRRAVELLETHYRNFYDKAAANVTKISRSRTAPTELREKSTYITQDMIDALFAGQKIPVAVEDYSQPPPTTPMPPQKNDDEDIIVPEFKPLLGEGDDGPPPMNITEEEALRLLRETLEKDSASRSELVEQTGTTTTPSSEITPSSSSSSTSSSETPTPPDAVSSSSESTATTNKRTEDPTDRTSTPKRTESEDGLNDGGSVVRNSEMLGATGTQNGSRPDGQVDQSPSLLSDNGKSKSAPQCNLTRQLTSLLETLSMRSRSHDPILDFLKRAIHSHTVMHPDDVRHFMRNNV